MKQFLLIWCFLLGSMNYNLAYAANLTLFCGNTSKNESFTLENPEGLVQSECFNASQTTMIFAFGFTMNATVNCTQQILDSYRSCGNYNIILFDWAKEVAALFDGKAGDMIGLGSYPLAYANAISVGDKCSTALNILSNSTLNTSLNLFNTVVVAISLGAQMVGRCGNRLQEKYNKTLHRIVALDPAGPGFVGLSTQFLNKGSATFVVVLHTTTTYGTFERVGKIDVWFNCNSTAQPQCVNDTQPAFCSHKASCFFYAEAVRESMCVKKETSFLAVSSGSCIQWASQTNKSNRTIYVGETTDLTADGNFYLATDAAYPYGKGEEGI